jgi:hypothetical protein
MPQLVAQEETPSMRTVTFFVASGARIRNVRFGQFDEQGRLTGSTRTGFRTSGRSLQYEYTGPMPLIFFEEEPAPTPQDPEGVRRTPVARANLPPETSEVMFLFNRNPDYPDVGTKYSVQWVNLDTAEIPAGHVTIFNTLGITMQGAVGQETRGETLTIAPGINPPLHIQPQASVVLALESKAKGLIRIYKDTINCGPDERILLLIFPPRFPGSHNVGSKLISFPLRKDDETATGEKPES